jgi:hypothetical protein
MWTYRTQRWGTASGSNIQILERFQSKALRNITNASWFLPNAVILRDLQTPTINEENLPRLSVHPNDLAVNLMTTRQQTTTKTSATPPAYQILSVHCNYKKKLRGF